LHEHGVRIETVKDAAVALKPLAGPYASVLFAFGIFNAALFAVTVMPLSTAYCICEGMGWEEGLDKGFKEAPQFYSLITIMIALGAGFVLIPNFPLLKVMYFSQVGNGLLLPFVLIAMLTLSNDPQIMGEYVNRPSFHRVAQLTIMAMVILNFILLFLSFRA